MRLCRRSLCRCAAVCASWRAAASGEGLWAQQLAREFGLCLPAGACAAQPAAVAHTSGGPPTAQDSSAEARAAGGVWRSARHAFSRLLVGRGLRGVLTSEHLPGQAYARATAARMGIVPPPRLPPARRQACPLGSHLRLQRQLHAAAGAVEAWRLRLSTAAGPEGAAGAPPSVLLDCSGAALNPHSCWLRFRLPGWLPGAAAASGAWQAPPWDAPAADAEGRGVDLLLGAQLRRRARRGGSGAPGAGLGTELGAGGGPFLPLLRSRPFRMPAVSPRGARG
jgi:hypothetical protein